MAALEADLKAIKKAREALGDQAPSFGRGGPPDGRHVLGKRRRDHEDDASSSDDQVPDDVKRIPMPRDTPPPIPKEIMDAWWAKRRAARQGNANLEPLQGDRLGHRRPDKAPAAERASGPPPEAKTVYEAKPVVRDLRREAVSAFVPTVVKVKLDKGIGKRGLLDPEEADRLEDEGYMKSSAPPAAAGDGGDTRDPHPRNVSMEDVRDEE